MNSVLLKKDKLFPFIKQYLPDNPIIVEAGAFNGTDTKLLSQFWPQATVHAFEPVPEIFTLLSNNTYSLSNVVRHNIALSDANGERTFYLSEKPSAPGKPFPAGSLHEPQDRLQWSPAVYNRTIIVPTITLDAWARAHAIHHIDFLWLDLQGHELSVLKAAPTILATVRTIYVEVQFVHAYKDQPLYEEVRNWLEEHGFVQVAHDFADQTSWFFGNALFVRS
ncbi:MAG TPA: FkbM family methyltransferase [Candidatus Babeliales bacterium]|nr:FkbM family methyltransferase [Candidatus Babeliales bacterium]